MFVAYTRAWPTWWNGMKPPSHETISFSKMTFVSFELNHWRKQHEKLPLVDLSPTASSGPLLSFHVIIKFSKISAQNRAGVCPQTVRLTKSGNALKWSSKKPCPWWVGLQASKKGSLKRCRQRSKKCLGDVDRDRLKRCVTVEWLINDVKWL